MPPVQPRRRLVLAPSLQRRVSRFTLLIIAPAVLLTGLGGYLATCVPVNRAVDAVLDTVSENALRSLGPDPGPAALEGFVDDSAELDDDIEIAVVEADGEVLRPDVGSRSICRLIT